jgi:hypothetical protein
MGAGETLKLSAFELFEGNFSLKTRHDLSLPRQVRLENDVNNVGCLRKVLTTSRYRDEGSFWTFNNIKDEKTMSTLVSVIKA